jgi:GntR family transcriptional regulator, transcriptional repressor for pyruvate dehydrogenase complex
VQKVADEIERRIRRGDWKFGARLPGRGTLAERTGFSGMAVRRALRELGERGVVRVLPSSGVYVTWRGHGEGTPQPLTNPRNPR